MKNRPVRRRFIAGLLSLGIAFTSLIFASPTRAQSGNLDIELRNKSSKTVKIVRWNPSGAPGAGTGVWESWGAINAGSTAKERTTAGTKWGLVNPATNQLLDSFTAGRFTRVLQVDDRDFAQASPSPGPAPGPGPITQEIEMHAHNHSSQKLYLYRDGGKGSYEYVATLEAGKEQIVSTPPNTTWVFVFPKDSSIVGRLKVTAGHTELDVHDKDLPGGAPAPKPQPQPQPKPQPQPQPQPKPQPQPPSPVAITWVNICGHTIEVVHKTAPKPGGSGQGHGHVETTLRDRYQQTLKVQPGDHFEVRLAANDYLMATYVIPTTSKTYTVSHSLLPSSGGQQGGGGGHQHGGQPGGGGGGGQQGGGGGGGGGGPKLPDPRDVLRRLFGRG